ncbi:hypothetical protein [Nonomuraea sp. SYSU D8015]|uniref:hypothetical protein n=1 Tax=Nonomuraea sp. SYSU D8015 TaxID=2593644 RepID=UPI0016616911|nr:hypothetical protein [Nonomuraea sp. SYSU D8015]
MTAARDAQTWLLLYARGRSHGYRLLMAPDFLNTGADLGRVARLVSQHRPEQVAVLSATGTLADGRRVHVLSRPSRLTPEDLGTASESDVLDEYGRPLEFTYGLLSLTGQPEADDDLWRRSRAQVVDVYRGFLIAEESFPLQSSPAFVIPVTGPASGAARAGTVTRVVTATTLKRGTLAATAAVLAVICFAALRACDGETPPPPLCPPTSGTTPSPTASGLSTLRPAPMGPTCHSAGQNTP